MRALADTVTRSKVVDAAKLVEHSGVTMHYVYILESLKDKSKYIGVTTDLKNRLTEHNNGETKSNKSKLPFKIAWYCAIVNKEIAYDFERYLKSSSGHAFTNKHFLTSKSDL